MKKITQIIVQFIIDNNITQIFAICGGYNMFILNEIVKNDIKIYYFHHQQALIMAAQGYYRMSQKIPLCIVTAGPGGTNTITGIYGGWTDSIPMFIISGQCSTNQMTQLSNYNCRQIGQQDSRMLQIVKPITKYSTCILNQKNIQFQLYKAYSIMINDKAGPVWIQIPLDVQSKNIEQNELLIYTPQIKQYFIENQKLDMFKQLLQNCKKPIIVIGNGIRLSDSYQLFNDFINKYNIPVMTGPHSGVDCVDNTYKYYMGRFGIHGQITSNKIIQQCDLLICIGSRLNFKMTGYAFDKFAQNAKKIIIDIDHNEIDKHQFKIDLSIVTSVKYFLTLIFDNMYSINIRQWQIYVLNIRKTQKFYLDKHKNTKNGISLYYFISKCKKFFKNIPIIATNGSAHVVTLQSYQLNKNQRLFTNVGCASMGYGLPAAIGASIANNNKEVICLQGDGSIMMNLGTIQTLSTYNLPVKLFIINNSGYVSARITQQMFCNSRYFDSFTPMKDISFPSFKLIAKAFKMKYFKIDKNVNIDKMLKKIMKYKDKCIIQLIVNSNEKHEPRVFARGIDQFGKIIPGLLTNLTYYKEDK